MTKKRTFIIGIDPGKSGAIAVIDCDNGYILECISMPVAGKDLDLSAINLFLSRYAVDTRCVFIEKVGAMPGQGVTSMFNFGFTVGAIHALVAAHQIPRYTVTPQAWKKLVLAGTLKDKAAAVDYCNRAFPQTSLLRTSRSKKPNDGMADAICIAVYGYKTFKQK